MLRRDAQDGIARCLVFRKKRHRITRAKIHLVHAEDDFFHPRELCEHEEAAHDERMRVGRCRRDGDDDLRQIRHARTLQQVRTLLDALDHALLGRYAFQSNEIAGDKPHIAAPLLDPAAQFAEDDRILCRDMEHIVVDLQDTSALCHHALPIPSFPSGSVVRRDLYRSSSYRRPSHHPLRRRTCCRSIGQAAQQCRYRPRCPLQETG